MAFILGCVYNITPYLEYHPGGIPEIMKGAGIDATQLFNEVMNIEMNFSRILAFSLDIMNF
jgi:cytochrome b involved in lipid metabolism